MPSKYINSNICIQDVSLLVVQSTKEMILGEKTNGKYRKRFFHMTPAFKKIELEHMSTIFNLVYFQAR